MHYSFPIARKLKNPHLSRGHGHGVKQKHLHSGFQVLPIPFTMAGFYVISNFVGYLKLNTFLYKLTVLLQTIQFSMCTQFNCQQYFSFKLFSLSKHFLHTVECQNRSILNNAV